MAVEFALFLPVLLMVIFSIIELGNAWYSKQMLINASREGARYTSLYQDANITEQDVVSQVQTQLNGAGYPYGYSVAVNGINGAPGDQVSVTIDSPYQFPVLGALISNLQGSITLTATTVMRHE